MAYLPTIDFRTFRMILTDLLSTTNTARSNAEEQYEKLSSVEKNYLLLSACYDDSLPVEEAELAAVLLRRLITSDFDEVYIKMPTEEQERIKSQLIHRLLQQTINSTIRKKISDAVAELARNYIDDSGMNQWQQYLTFLFQGASSPDPVLREIVLLMLAAVPGVFGSQQAKYIGVLNQMLLETLQDAQSFQVRYAAVKAFSAFVLANDRDVQKQFTGCVTIMLQLLDNTLQSKEPEADPDEILRCLVDMVESCPQFFKGNLDNLFGVCLKGISNEENLPPTRQLCLEVIVTICEAAAAMIRRLGHKHLSNIIFWCLRMMTELEDDPNWDFIDDENLDDENDSNSTVAEAGLDRLSCTLGGKALLPIVMPLLQQMLSSGNWKERYAGLMAISAVGEGCHKQMSAILPKVVEGVLPFLFDQGNTRVRYAACNAIGQMSTDFAPVFQKKFHEKVISLLLQLLSDPSSARVQAHAGAALVNFFEDCPKSILSPYMHNIVSQLESVLTSKLQELADKGTKLVLEQVVVTLASLADSAQEKFIEYYDKFMPCLKFIIQNANQPHLLTLRGKTIECVSLIGVAVGREKFLPDASEVMDFLLKSQVEGTVMAEDDPQLSYMITAWARMCTILGKDFRPYLQFVMGPVLKAAALKPEIALLDSDEMKVVGNDDDWEFVHLGQRHNFGIRTAGLEDKATACTMLVCYARELKESFVNFIEETLHLMIPMLKFYFHDGVRMAASEIMPPLLESAKVKGEAYLQQVWMFMLSPLLNALESEPEIEVLSEHLSSFSECIKILKGRCLAPENLTHLIKILNKHIHTHFLNTEERENRKKDEDYDETTEEDLIKLEDGYYFMLSKISELICTLFATYKNEFLSYFDKLAPLYGKLLHPKRNWQDHQWALCVFTDIIEHCGYECSQYHQYFLQPILNGITNEDSDLRQTASYSVGALALHGGPDYFDFCAKSALPLLISMINSPDSRSEENERATENAISSVTKIFMSNNPLVNPDEIIPVWITWLPIWEDSAEAKYVFSVLCTLLQTNNASLLGNESCNIPRIVYIVAEAFHKEALESNSDVGKKLLSLIKDIQNNTELFSLCLSHLTAGLQEALHKAITN